MARLLNININGIDKESLTPLMYSVQKMKLWQNERSYRIVNDDIRDLERVKEINAIELLVDSLPAGVGSPLSLKNLSDDLEVHHATIKSWIQILDNIYYSYRISPFGGPKIRAVKKEHS